jgi:hypothetical protein
LDKSFPCICSHRYSKHTKSNGKSWGRLQKQLDNYKDTPKNRHKFWFKYLTGSTPDEFQCSECDCSSFKMDNLRFLEDKLEKKKCQSK